ncbi:unnamed protein product [Lepidochelys kempii]
MGQPHAGGSAGPGPAPPALPSGRRTQETQRHGRAGGGVGGSTAAALEEQPARGCPAARPHGCRCRVLLPGVRTAEVSSAAGGGGRQTESPSPRRLLYMKHT